MFDPIVPTSHKPKQNSQKNKKNTESSSKTKSTNKTKQIFTNPQKTTSEVTNQNSDELSVLFPWQKLNDSRGSLLNKNQNIYAIKQNLLKYQTGEKLIQLPPGHTDEEFQKCLEEVSLYVWPGVQKSTASAYQDSLKHHKDRKIVTKNPNGIYSLWDSSAEENVDINKNVDITCPKKPDVEKVNEEKLFKSHLQRLKKIILPASKMFVDQKIEMPHLEKWSARVAPVSGRSHPCELPEVFADHDIDLKESYLNLQGWRCGDDYLKNLLELHTGIVRHVNLENCRLTDESSYEISSILHNLHTLNISENFFSKAGICEIINTGIIKASSKLHTHTHTHFKYSFNTHFKYSFNTHISTTVSTHTFQLRFQHTHFNTVSKRFQKTKYPRSNRVRSVVQQPRRHHDLKIIDKLVKIFQQNHQGSRASK